jgi:hypothetical protein
VYCTQGVWYPFKIIIILIFWEMEAECRSILNNLKKVFISLFGESEYVITPYIHKLFKLDRIQSKLGYKIGYFQNSRMYHHLC